MAHWKVKLVSDDNTITQLQQAFNTEETHIRRDGIDWFLESNEFEMFTDYIDVKNKAWEMVLAMLNNGPIPPNSVSMALGAVYRIHYDNSKTVYRD